MTNEKAIEILEECWRYARTYKYTDAEIREAFDMAIKALEQEDVLGKIRAEIANHCGLLKENHCRYCSYCNSVMGIREIIEVIDKYKAESEE